MEQSIVVRDKEYTYRRIFTRVTIPTGVLFITLFLDQYAQPFLNSYIEFTFIILWFIGQALSYVYGGKVISLRFKSPNKPRLYRTVFGSKMIFILSWLLQTCGTIFLGFALLLLLAYTQIR